jgi:hypothetical protein
MGWQESMKALFGRRAKRFFCGFGLCVVWRQWSVELYRDVSNQRLNASHLIGSDRLQPFRVRGDVPIEEIQNDLLG